MLLCPICQVRVLTDNRSQDLITKWQYRRGDAWDYRDNGTPYWVYCVKCHMRRSLNDRRYANEASRPAPFWLHREASGRQRLFARDFWLTAPPPERASLLAGCSLYAEETGSHSSDSSEDAHRVFGRTVRPRLDEPAAVATPVVDEQENPRPHEAGSTRVSYCVKPTYSHTNCTNRIETVIQTVIETYTNCTNREKGEKEIINLFIISQFV